MPTETDIDELIYLHTAILRDAGGVQVHLEIYHDPVSNCLVGLDSTYTECHNKAYSPYVPCEFMKLPHEDKIIEKERETYLLSQEEEDDITCEHCGRVWEQIDIDGGRCLGPCQIMICGKLPNE